VLALVHRMSEVTVEPFEEVATRLAPRLYRAAVSICRDPHDAEDVVQDTLMQAFSKWHQFEGRSDPATWLYTIAARICRRHRRPRAGAPAVLESVEELLPSESGAFVDFSRRGDPAKHFDAASLQAAVARAVAELPPTFRIPLVLVDIAEMSTVEAALILGIKEGTVKTRVHRARLKLRQVLTAALPTHQQTPCDHDRHVCLDLLKARQDALDRKVPFTMSDHALCDRCGAVSATLDLAIETCQAIGRAADLPDATVSAIIGRCRV
jgi:RNA polymerase sigma-70 factor, ECF subfamily